MRKIILTLSHSIRRWRILSAFLAICLFNALLFILCELLSSEVTAKLIEKNGEFIHEIAGSSSEIWLGILTLVLGTLIIVISIASQNTPKLIDFYISDWMSLLFTWSLVIEAVLTLVLLGANQNQVGENGSAVITYSTFEVLLVLIMLPTHYVLSVPYIFNILNFSKTENQVKRIHRRIEVLLKELNYQFKYQMNPSERWIDGYQRHLFKYINQLDELLDFIKLKESRDVIIRTLGDLLLRYQSQKKEIHSHYFRLGESIQSDATMVTLYPEFEDISKNQTFLEQKVFRILGNTYWRLIQEEEFELANRCSTVVAETGIEAIHQGNNSVVDLSLIRFNNFTRFGLKHAIKTSELRNLYNSIYQYGRLVSVIIEKKDFKRVDNAVYFLRQYAQEIYKASRNNVQLVLLTDVFALEICRILKYSYEADTHKEHTGIIYSCINALKAVERPQDVVRADVEPSWIKVHNTLDVQLNAILYFLSKGETQYVEELTRVFTSDFDHLGPAMYWEMVDIVISKVREARQHFWEDTDRGRQNIFYSEHQNLISDFVNSLRSLLPVTTKSID